MPNIKITAPIKLVSALNMILVSGLLAFLPSLRAAPGDLKWAFRTDGAVRSSPALGTNGLVYFGSADSKIYAVDAGTGAKRWELATGAPVISSPAIGPDGTVFIGSTDGALYACDGATGRKRWSFGAGDQVISSPALGANGWLYVTSWNGTIYAVDSATGNQIWSADLNASGTYASPSVGPGGMVFCGGSHSLLAFDGVTGEIHWQFDSANVIQSTPAIGADGTVFIPSYDKLVYALDPLTGAKKWSHFTGDSISSSPTIGGDGTVYVGSNDGRLYALDPADGSEKWTFHTDDTVHSSPAVASDGTVYFGSYDKNVYALDGKTGAEKWRFVTGGLVLSSPVIGADGTVFIGSLDGNLYALEGASPPAQSSWPAFRGGGQHTGSTEHPGPPVMIHPPGNLLAAEGANTFLDGVVQGSRPMLFQWLFNGQPLVQAAAWTTNSRLEIPAARLADSGPYTLIASNALGEVSASGRLDVGFVLTTTPGTGGQVSREPDQGIYLPGTVVRLTAKPDQGRGFLGWHGDASGLTNPLSITVNSPKQVAAMFTVAPGEKLWDIPVAPYGSSVVAIGDDNTVFVGGATTNLLALDGDTGWVKWQFNTTDTIQSAVAVAGDGTVVFVPEPNFVCAVDGNTGAQKWKVAVAGLLNLTPAIGADGSVYIGSQASGNSALVALNGTNGAVKWRYDAGRVTFNGTAPAVGTNGSVYITTGCDWTVTAVDAITGQSSWKAGLGVCWGSPLALGGEGAVYIQSQSGLLYALSATTGATLWTNALPTAGSVAPIVGPDETVYLMNGNDGCVAIDGRSGRIKPSFKPVPALNLSPAAPALAVDGTLYATGSDRILALDSGTAVAEWAAAVPGINGMPLTIGPDGTIYAVFSVNNETRLMAIKGTSGLADAPWPMVGDNARNTSALNDGRPLRVNSIVVSSSEVRVTLPTKLGRLHHLEFKNSLADRAWTRALTITGDGTEMTLRDSQNPGTQRFYRIRVE
ncbi:MAG: outer membrane protein assembly factor BamB family protein [Limisphaerales bacterium]